MEVILIIVFCILVLAPGILCNKDGVDVKQKRRIMTIWGAVGGMYCLMVLFVVGSMTLGVPSGTGGVFRGKLDWLNGIFDVLCLILPAIVGALVGYMTEETNVLSIVWRMIKIFILMIAVFFVMFLLTEFVNSPGTFWTMLAIVAVIAGFSMEEPGWLLIIFK